AHPTHQRRDVSSADIVSLALQSVDQLAGPVKRQLQVQLVDPPHQPQIPFRHSSRRVVHARATQPQQLGLSLHRHVHPPRNHRLPLKPGNFPSAPSKKSRSTVSSPIFACSSRIRSRSSLPAALPPKIAAAFSNSWLFHAVTWVGCTSWCA